MKCSCGFERECPIWCGTGHLKGLCPPYNANNDVRELHNRPKCRICGDVAPYGDARNQWSSAHKHRARKLLQKLRKRTEGGDA